MEAAGPGGSGKNLLGLNDLKNRTALVTGASRGIGKAIALRLAEAGADVAVHYNTRRDEAISVTSAIKNSGRHSFIVQSDLSAPGLARELIQKVEKEFGSIDILVNNAGIAQQIPPEEITEKDWDRMFDINLKSVFLLTQSVIPEMRRKKWGRIINLSSVAAQTGGLVGPHYAASKAGIIGLTHFFAAYLVKDGITVNAIAPALIETDMVTKSLKASPGHIPMVRFGTADEAASAALMLALNGYITGQTINLNGGLYMSS